VNAREQREKERADLYKATSEMTDLRNPSAVAEGIQLLVRVVLHLAEVLDRAPEQCGTCLGTGRVADPARGPGYWSCEACRGEGTVRS
jgi:hypothetical protein